MHNDPIITITTDFGLSDEYVATMKGVILSLLPEARFVDISHNVPPQDIYAATHILNRAYRYYPPRTLHLVIVDPNVGTERKMLAVEADKHLFVAPDNGVLTPILKLPTAKVHSITQKGLFLQEPCSSFHGRDILAPVAARLAGPMPLFEVGPSLEVSECTLFDLPAAVAKKNTITGEVIYIDHYGNLCTNITKEMLTPLSDKGKIVVHIGPTTILGLSGTYSESRQKRPLAHYDSHDHLEIAVSGGSAKHLLQVGRGEKVVVELSND